MSERNIKEMQEQFLKEALAHAMHNVDALEGGPFGAVVVKEGKIVAGAWNRVVQDTDPTAHAEIMAIREASRVLGTYNLSGCTLYSSCEPCPMCLAAIWWSRIDACYYAASRDDAASAGFDDAVFYEELKKPAEDRLIKVLPLPIPDAALPFLKWKEKGRDIRY
jgi:guanine deaminase